MTDIVRILLDHLDLDFEKSLNPRMKRLLEMKRKGYLHHHYNKNKFLIPPKVDGETNYAAHNANLEEA